MKLQRLQKLQRFQPLHRLVVAADDWRGCHHDGARGKGHGFLVAVSEENQLSMNVYVKHCETSLTGLM